MLTIIISILLTIYLVIYCKHKYICGNLEGTALHQAESVKFPIWMRIAVFAITLIPFLNLIAIIALFFIFNCSDTHIKHEDSKGDIINPRSHSKDVFKFHTYRMNDGLIGANKFIASYASNPITIVTKKITGWYSDRYEFKDEKIVCINDDVNLITFELWSLVKGFVKECITGIRNILTKGV